MKNKVINSNFTAERSTFYRAYSALRVVQNERMFKE